MSGADDPKKSVFFDSNVLLYLTSGDASKASRAEQLLLAGGVVSVQVLNEVAEVSRRRFRMDWPEVDELLLAIRSACTVWPLSAETHESGIRIAQRFGFGVYDSMIVAAAIEANCTTLFSEDMHHGQRIERTTLRNPFVRT